MGGIILLFFHRVVRVESVFMFFCEIYRAQDCGNLPTDWRNPECGSGIKTARVEMGGPFCLLYLSIIREGAVTVGRAIRIFDQALMST